MKWLCFIWLILITTCYSFSQTSFYILSGGNITKVENIDQSQLNITEWQVRLYKKGASKSGNGYWGTIKGSTSEDVMQKLKFEQDFELRFNAFIGNGKVQDAILTHFNALGPIAVIDEVKPTQTATEVQIEPTSEVYDKTTESFSTYLEAKNKLDVILKGKPINPFDNYGRVFKEYTTNLKDAIKQVTSLRTLLVTNSSIKMDIINERIASIDSKLETANTNQKQFYTSIDEITNQTQGNSNNDTSLKLSLTDVLLIQNFPNKYKNPILTVLASGKGIERINNSIPDELTVGMTTQQKIYFKDFINDIYHYGISMGWSFGLLSYGSIGYGYLNNNEIYLDKADQYYRENVMQNEQILESSNYNSYYSNALLEKGKAAFNLYKLLNSDPSINKSIKIKILQYGINNVSMIYLQVIDGYQDTSVVREKELLLVKLNECLK